MVIDIVIGKVAGVVIGVAMDTDIGVDACICVFNPRQCWMKI